MSLHTQGRTRWRRVAVAATTTLAATTLTLMAPAAHADEAAEVAPVFTWGISEQFRSHFTAPFMPGSAITPTGGATYADNLATFVDGTGTADPRTGTASVEYTGTITGNFGTFYSVAISDPAVTVDADGSGEVTAVVSGAEPGGDGGSTEPARVKVADFDESEVVEGAIRATPNWTGALAPGSPEAAELEIEEGDPVDGASFAPEFVTQITTGVRAHFYDKGSANPKKVIAPFTAAVPEPAEEPVAVAPKTVTKVTAASPANGLSLKVNGTGFNPATNPGDQGVYVGIARANVEIDFGDRDSVALFAAVDWVTPARFTGGSFVSVLNAPTSKLKKGTPYAVYTWQAHTHSNATQDTKKSAAVPWARLTRRKTPLTVKVAKAPTTKAFGRLGVTVKPVAGWAKPSGKVNVTLKKGKATRRVVGKLNKKGAVSLRLPRIAKGQWKATVRYAGNANYKANVRAVGFRVRR